MTLITWKSYVRVFLLSAVTAVFSVGSAPIDSQAAAISLDATAPKQHSSKQNALPEIITGMEVGMPYAEARALIDSDIWAPKIHPPLDYVSTSVQNMRDFGYGEVRDCAGTGLGLCRMEFIEREGLILVIIVTTSEAEPMVWSWDVEQTIIPNVGLLVWALYCPLRPSVDSDAVVEIFGEDGETV